MSFFTTSFRGHKYTTYSESANQALAGFSPAKGLFLSHPSTSNKVAVLRTFPRWLRVLLRRGGVVPPMSQDGHSRCRVAELRADLCSSDQLNHSFPAYAVSIEETKTRSEEHCSGLMGKNDMTLSTKKLTRQAAQSSATALSHLGATACQTVPRGHRCRAVCHWRGTKSRGSRRGFGQLRNNRLGNWARSNRQQRGRSRQVGL